jgi:hypothetical protein
MEAEAGGSRKKEPERPAGEKNNDFLCAAQTASFSVYQRWATPFGDRASP